MFNGIVENLISQLQTRTNRSRPLIVGIDGLGGAGKTTIVKNIEQALNHNNCKVTTIHMDDHIVERDKRYETGNEEWYEYYYLQWDLEMLKTNLFEVLNNNCENIFLPFYDMSTDSNSNKHINVAVDGIVLIEGIFLQREEWRDFYDYIIFLDCPGELRVKRVLNRDSYIGDHQAIINKYSNRYWLGEKHYLDVAKPIKNADLVITTNFL